MSVSIYHFPTPNGFVSVVGSANPSLGYSTARLDTLFVTVGERRMGGPRMGEMSPWGQLQHLGLFHTHTNGSRRNSICVCCRLWLAIPRILGSQGSSISYSWVSVVVGRTWSRKDRGPWLCPWCWIAAVPCGVFRSPGAGPQSTHWRGPCTTWYGMSQPLLRVRTLLGPSTDKTMGNPNFTYTDQN